ncbi:hypothetical protein PoB_003475600 [Plakobranchus ocellatus]|uniref:Uncharacterized protein n=1 Tax=Plakobranchus ocellatus TaxID=259542 RepID=A0AAV4ANU4_9GAST|nr:hypothetical protein PoB_003475600 [Plakobranchus ocellatus]
MIEDFCNHRVNLRGFLYIASPQQGDLRLQGPPSGRGADGGARTRDRRVPADLRVDSQATLPPTPPVNLRKYGGSIRCIFFKYHCLIMHGAFRRDLLQRRAIPWTSWVSRVKLLSHVH